MAVTKITWKDGMAFDVDLLGYSFKIDADSQFGGKGYGPVPKPLVLSALAGCTGMDVVAILNKMQMPFQGFEVAVEGDLTSEHPKVYHSIQIQYRFKGPSLELEKIQKAIKLSLEKYCGVAAMLKKTATITYEVYLNEERVAGPNAG
ncbi:MAG: OsmC family protein [Spirochaetes bacterium]|nr:OsmC family protein [Spirochaetota bacterium]